MHTLPKEASKEARELAPPAREWIVGEGLDRWNDKVKESGVLYHRLVIKRVKGRRK